ncbi:MAG: hypothetical protein M1829_004837 [Trizodia sp. TS-e1964]|nr:MAG: hypothetical protein M1829_004837 [Trizodia sp. TS-e1964]
MGANQSSGGGGYRDGDDEYSGRRRRLGPVTKTCYYELLSVDRHASDDEIKKAYRKKALELHPDRNFGNIENTTKLFAEVQSAYEILSDPQERAWYDAHRDAILRDDDDVDADSGGHFEHSTRVTTSIDLMRLFTRLTSNHDFSDSPSGFFAVLGKTFDSLAKEEVAACEWEGIEPIVYPSFGDSNSGYEEVVRPFYAAWNGFATKKPFSSMDFHRPSEAPDRRLRRMMERENKRLREEGIKEFNEGVRMLVAFIRKRDPRYIPNTRTEDERQKSLRDATAAQAARSRAANRAKLDTHVEPAWSRVEKSELESPSTGESIEVLEDEVIECVACKKTFKSENQFETHELSKKHKKMLQHLRRELEREEVELGITAACLETPEVNNSTGLNSPEITDPSWPSTPGVVSEDLPIEAKSPPPEEAVVAPAITKPSPSNEATTDEEINTPHAGPPKSPLKTAQNGYLDPTETLEATLSASLSASAIGESLGGSTASTPIKKLGKAKEKRAKKAAAGKTGEEV